jgi:8-oxo-dGTP diphosphatase
MDTGTGVKGIIRKDDHFLVLVKPDGTFDLPGGRVEEGETIQSALHREINEETGLNVDIKETVGKWSFPQKPNFVINGITFACTYLKGTVELCDEHTNYFWVGIDKIQRLTFSREIQRHFKYMYPSYCK